MLTSVDGEHSRELHGHDRWFAGYIAAVINPEFNGTEDITFTATDLEGGSASDTTLSSEVTAVLTTACCRRYPEPERC